MVLQVDRDGFASLEGSAAVTIIRLRSTRRNEPPWSVCVASSRPMERVQSVVDVFLRWTIVMNAKSNVQLGFRLRV